MAVPKPKEPAPIDTEAERAEIAEAEAGGYLGVEASEALIERYRSALRNRRERANAPS